MQDYAVAKPGVPSHLEILAFYGLLATILVAAVPYGTAALWQKSLLVAIIAIFAGLRVIDSVVRGPFRIAEPLILLPLAGVLCFAVIQTLPLPGLASAISLDPYETRAFSLILFGLIAGLEVLYYYTTSKHRVKSLIGLVLVVGLASAIFGIARDVYFDAQTDLLRQYLPFNQGYAQFINRNHFAFLIEMAFGLLLGILIKGEISGKIKFCGCVCAGILIYAAISANSRGGLAGITALTLTAVPLHLITRNKNKSYEHDLLGRLTISRSFAFKIFGTAGLCGLVLALIVVTISFVGGDAVVSRIEKIKHEVQTVDPTVVNRRHIWNSTIELIKSEPILGVGFGAYATAIPRFDSSGGEFALEQAHNDYLEILSTGGIVGFVLFGVFGAMVFSRISKNLRSGDPFTQSSCFGAALGILGVLIHSLVDFGLHVMINALILAVLVVIATANRAARAV